MRDRLLTAIAASNWALHRPVLDNLTMIAFRHAMGIRVDQAEVERIVEARSSGPERGGDRGYSLRGAVAVVPIGGVIAKHASRVNGSSQPRGTATETIDDALANAQADAEVGSILLHIESPGGTVDGVEGLADRIHAMRSSGKPVWTLASDMMASAAYWIGSQASKVYAESRTTEIGSIGVYVAVPDFSRMYENEGVRMNVIASGPDKGAGVAGAPVTDAHKALWQERVDGIAEVFKQAAARGRGMAMDAMNQVATGRVFGADDAHRLGLIDGVMSADAVIAEMNRLYPSPRARSGNGSAAPRGSATGAIMDPKDLQSKAGAAGGTGTATGSTGGGVVEGGRAEGGGGSAAAGGAGQPGLRLVGTDDAVRLDREANAARIRDIQTRARPWMNDPTVGAFVTELVMKAATDTGITPDGFSAQVMNKLQEVKAPTGNASDVQVGQDGWTRKLGATQAVLLERISPEVQSILDGRGVYDASARGERRDLSDRVAQKLGYTDAKQLRDAYARHAADGVRGQSLIDTAHQCLVAAGMGHGLNPMNGSHRAKIAELALTMPALAGYGATATGHGRSDFPFLMSEVMNRSLLASGTAVELIYPEVAYIGSANDFRSQTYGDVSAVGDFEEIKTGARPKMATASDRAEKLALTTFGKGFKITRAMIVNDDLGGIQIILQRIGEAAARLPDQRMTAKLVANPAMSDGVALFHATHRNLAAPGTAFDLTSAQAAWTAMRQQRSHGKGASVITPVTPDRVMVPTAIRFKAEELYKAQYDPTRSATVANQQPNTMQGRFRPIENPYLDAYSATGWYALANPMQKRLLQVNFLNGQRTPTTTLIGDGSILERAYEVIFDVEVAPIEWEAGYFNPGA